MTITAVPGDSRRICRKTVSPSTRGEAQVAEHDVERSLAEELDRVRAVRGLEHVVTCRFEARAAARRARPSPSPISTPSIPLPPRAHAPPPTPSSAPFRRGQGTASGFFRRALKPLVSVRRSAPRRRVRAIEKHEALRRVGYTVESTQMGSNDSQARQTPPPLIRDLSRALPELRASDDAADRVDVRARPLAAPSPRRARRKRRRASSGRHRVAASTRGGERAREVGAATRDAARPVRRGERRVRGRAPARGRRRGRSEADGARGALSTRRAPSLDVEAGHMGMPLEEELERRGLHARPLSVVDPVQHRRGLGRRAERRAVLGLLRQDRGHGRSRSSA